MKLYIFIIFYIFSGISCILAKENEIDNIIAIVNDQVILNSDVNQMLFLLKNEGKDFRIPLNSNFLKDQVIEKLIVDSLILQEANRMNIKVTKTQINNIIKNISFKKHISVHQLKNNILFHNINYDYSYNDYVKNIKKLLKIKIVQNYELHKRINISENEVNLLFKEIVKKNKELQKINLSYILLPFLNKESDNIFRNRKILAENIVNKLKKGYDFEKFYIDCKKNNSLFLVKKMFWMRFADIQNNFSETLNFIKKGEILGPFLADKGFYILKVNDIHNNEENIVTEFYIQHCLIKPSNSLESKDTIYSIYNNIKKGVYSFDYAVKNLSHDFYSSNKKGDLGWVSKELFNVDLEKELSNLNKNEISKPIQSDFGWHIIKLLDKRQVDKFYNFKKKQAYNILLNQKMMSEKYNWIKDLKNKSYIKIMRP